MAAILDGPVATINVEDPLWVSLLRRSAGNAVSNFTRVEVALFLYGVPFDEEGLSNVGKVKVVVEFGGGPDLPGLDSAVVRGRMFNEIRFLPVLEV